MSTAAKVRRVGSSAMRQARRRLLHKVPAPKRHGTNASVWAVREKPLWEIRDRYQGSFPVPEISYGTAGDLADSTDHLLGLVDASFDLKDLQRCWVVKAILGNVPAGSRLLEIGAGEPLVAGMLSRLGYEVTVVDPYDGSGNGPESFGVWQKAYPDLTFVRDTFPPAQPLEGEFGAIYSISVLEHIPLEAIDAVMSGSRERLSAGGHAIHAVDHVLSGWSAEEHLAGLKRIAAGLGIADAELEATLAQLSDDPETYFVSAESHNRWRGALPYEEYRMRRIVSVNFCVTV